MGFGYAFICEKCNETFFACSGYGMNFPAYYQEVIQDIENGTYGDEWNDTLCSRPSIAVDAECYIYKCSKCGHWEVAASLSLYVPRTEEIVGVNDNDFVCPDSLKQYYRCIRRYNHKCPECGSRMKKAATEQEESMLPCPKCGAVCHGEPVLWD